MTAWRELYTKVLQIMNDETAVSFNETLVLSFCELILNVALIRTRSVLNNNKITFLSDTIVPGFSYVPVVNVHTLLDDVSVIIAARSDGKRLPRSGFNALTAFEDAWRTRQENQEFYTIGETLFGLRPMPEEDQQVSITYVPYVEVDSLDAVIPLTDDYRLALEALLLSLLWSRLGHFDRANALFDDGMGALLNVRNRNVRV